MTQVTIVKRDDWNEHIFTFIESMDEKNFDSAKKKDLLMKYIEVQNVRFTFEKFMLSMEEINNCLLIIRGGDHVMTIKFEL